MKTVKHWNNPLIPCYEQVVRSQIRVTHLTWWGLFISRPSGQSAGAGKSVGERASASGRAEEEALRRGRSSFRAGFWAERRDLLDGLSCQHVTKTQQAGAFQEAGFGPETQPPTQIHGEGCGGDAVVDEEMGYILINRSDLGTPKISSNNNTFY